MSQYDDLKRAAEACSGLLPIRYMESHGALFIRNDHGIVFDVHQNRDFPAFMAANKAYADLVLAANPAAVVALIADNERLERKNANQSESIREYQDLVMGGDVSLGMLKADLRVTTGERDQLKAEVEALRKDAERYRWFRKQHWDSSAICAVVDPKLTTKLGAYCPSGQLLDDAVDAGLAMSKEASQCQK